MFYNKRILLLPTRVKIFINLSRIPPESKPKKRSHKNPVDSSSTNIQTDIEAIVDLPRINSNRKNDAKLEKRKSSKSSREKDAKPEIRNSSSSKTQEI